MLNITHLNFMSIFSLFVLILLVMFLKVYLKRIWEKSFWRLKNNYNALEFDCNSLIKEKEKLLRLNNELKTDLVQTIALYDITKEICKSLDEERVFNLFKSQVAKYIKLYDCRFLKNESDLGKYPGYTVMPVKIDNTPVGYFIASGIKESEAEKFSIMSQQLELGIKRAILYQRVQELAITDSLTGVLSRRYWMEKFQQEIERSKKFKFKFSFLMVDIDQFKSINDRYGHLVGDAVLKEVARRIKDNLRQIDFIGRYGGEEFAAILIETDKETARFAAERIRQAVEEKGIKVYDEELRVTISLGVSGFPLDALLANNLIEKADQALYSAKQTGRNKVCLSS